MDRRKLDPIIVGPGSLEVLLYDIFFLGMAVAIVVTVLIR